MEARARAAAFAELRMAPAMERAVLRRNGTQADAASATSACVPLRRSTALPIAGAMRNSAKAAARARASTPHPGWTPLRQSCTTATSPDVRELRRPVNTRQAPSWSREARCSIRPFRDRGGRATVAGATSDLVATLSTRTSRAAAHHAPARPLLVGISSRLVHTVPVRSATRFVDRSVLDCHARQLRVSLNTPAQRGSAHGNMCPDGHPASNAPPNPLDTGRGRAVDRAFVSVPAPTGWTSRPLGGKSFERVRLGFAQGGGSATVWESTTAQTPLSTTVPCGAANKPSAERSAADDDV